MTPEEIEAAVRQAGGSIASLCRGAEIATSTFGRWKRGETSLTLDVYDRIVAALNAAQKGQQNAIIVLPAVARAIDDVTVRQQLEKFTEPLRQEGLNAIRFKDDGGVQEQITTADAPAFTASHGREPTSQATFQATYQIKRLYFERGKKWRLSNGTQSILVHIEDELFWKRIDAAEVAFSADDYLVCEVRMDQWFDGVAGLKTECVVLRVINHIPAQKQDRFPGT